MPQIDIRPASVADADQVLHFSQIASHGFLTHVLQQFLPQGRDLQEFMLDQARDPDSKISWAKCWVAEIAGQPVGMMNLDPIAENPEPVPDDTPPSFRPLAELEAQAAGTQVIEFLATLSAARGQGVGHALLDKAWKLRGPAGVALVVSDANTGARRLYQATGFVEIDRRPIVKNGWDTPSTEWILMQRKPGPL